ncbi:MAG: hypothetical protein BGO04_01070 [Microbacterium sp. 70-38]|nr:MAG: hypothetical protein BGO04_01070 [Microbacterium sp. 70-38]
MAAAVRRAGGVARTRTLRAEGVSARGLRHAVETGDLVRPRQGIFALPATDPRMLDAAAHGGVPACATAAALHGLWTLPHDELHVWLGRAGSARAHDRCRCHLHWDRGDVTVGTLPPIPLVLVQVAWCRGEEAFFAALESALRQGLLSSAETQILRPRLPVSIRWLVDFARTDADSGLESLVRLRLHRHGISVRCQVHVFATGVVDFLIGDRLLLEIDGKPNHDGPSHRHKDLVRDANSAAWDFETLRFDYAMVIHDWPLVEDAILAKVRAGAHLQSAR